MANEIVSYDSAWAERAQRIAQQEQAAASTFLSTRGGTLSFGEEQMPGNQAAVIVLDSVKENTYYGTNYDAENPQAPICYAFGRDADVMAPHPSMQTDLNYFKPQCSECASCPLNEWGSADKGKGKACQNRRRLALIPAGFYQPKRGSRDFDLELFTDSEHYKTAEIAFIKLPVTSVKGWGKYVTQINTQLQRPPAGVVTRLFLEPDPKSQYMVHFEMIDSLPDELAPIILKRMDEAEKATIQGYKPPEVKDQKVAAAGGLRGLRR